MARKRSALGATIAGLIVLTSACSPSGTADTTAKQGLTPITIAVSALSPPATPLWLGLDQGIYKKHGLDAKIVYLQGGSLTAQGIMSGSVNFALLSVDALVATKLQGGDIGSIAGCVDGSYFSIYARAGVTKLADLKGKKIGSSGPGSASEYGITEAMSAAGLSKDDYTLVSLGGVSLRLAALKTGSVDATILSPPATLLAKRDGLTEVVDLIQSGIPGGYCAIGAQPSWVTAHQATAQAFVDAYVESVALSRAKPDLAKQSLSKWTKETDAQVLNEGYNKMLTAMQSPPINPNAATVKASLARQDSPNAKDAETASFLIPGYVEKARA